MKKVSIICFFSFLCLFIIGYGIGRWNYPNQKQLKQDNQDANISLSLSASSAQYTTTCDTIYVVQKCNESTGLMTTDIQSIPAQYIDHTREEMIGFLEDYEKNPSLQDKKDGFIHISLLSFSPERIVISKNYKTLSTQNGYYLIAVNHQILVYYEDKERLYFKTELSLDDFPEPVQIELIHGKYMSSESEVYAFLESYTS